MRRFEHHGNAGQDGDDDHDPVLVGDQTQQLAEMTIGGCDTDRYKIFTEFIKDSFYRLEFIGFPLSNYWLIR